MRKILFVLFTVALISRVFWTNHAARQTNPSWRLGQKNSPIWALKKDSRSLKNRRKKMADSHLSKFITVWKKSILYTQVGRSSTIHRWHPTWTLSQWSAQSGSAKLNSIYCYLPSSICNEAALSKLKFSPTKCWPIPITDNINPAFQNQQEGLYRLQYRICKFVWIAIRSINLHFLNNSVNHDFLEILCLDSNRKKAEPR